MSIVKLVRELAREVAALREEVRRLRSKSTGAVSRAVLSAIDTAGGFARASLSLRADEEREDVEVAESYGFTSSPPAGAEGVALAVGGDGAHHVVLGLGSRTLRIKNLAGGEVAVYSQHGQQILLKANGDVVITPSSTGNVYLGQDGATKKVALVDEVNDLRSAFNSHTHPTAPVGPVSTPTPVPLVIPVLPFAGATNVYAKG